MLNLALLTLLWVSQHLSKPVSSPINGNTNHTRRTRLLLNELMCVPLCPVTCSERSTNCHGSYYHYVGFA